MLRRYLKPNVHFLLLVTLIHWSSQRHKRYSIGNLLHYFLLACSCVMFCSYSFYDQSGISKNLYLSHIPPLPSLSAFDSFPFTCTHSCLKTSLPYTLIIVCYHFLSIHTITLSTSIPMLVHQIYPLRLVTAAQVTLWTRYEYISFI